MRNLTAHTYKESTASTVYENVPNFISFCEKLVKVLVDVKRNIKRTI